LDEQDLVLSPKKDEEEDLFVDEDSQIFMPKLLSTDPDCQSTALPKGKSEENSSTGTTP
jgi:hypothetical protein